MSHKLQITLINHILDYLNVISLLFILSGVTTNLKGDQIGPSFLPKRLDKLKKLN